MRLRLTAEAVSLDTVLSEAGLRPIGACPLFRLVETDNAQALFETLAARAILTRPFIENPRWLRFGLPADENAFVRLKEALVHG
ncbi:cobalamin biosynthetic protein CobC [Sphingobium wenxiniae]|uniref:Cobalamin biosynthetic protein CobC n=2 Tax=Sphingomonadaceae TaxID=41297 RepID=A0A562K214_SPHWJ|nr:cobalamin biosynthetic protein CobC [Sphingobium wenxiniae]TWH89471.1 cobalamin biosynthetic protein CobC [Sphingobium wenxiniae]